VSLRHREGQGWTTKLPPEKDGGALLVRGEFTFLGEDATTPPDEAIDLIRAYVRTATLRPVVRLRTIRRLIQLLDMEDRLLAEVVDDEVSVLSGRRIAARFRELEVEITEGVLVDPREVLERLRAAGAGAPDPTPSTNEPWGRSPPASRGRGGAAHLGVDREPGPEQDARHVGHPPPSPRRRDPIGCRPRRGPSSARGHSPPAIGPSDVPFDARSRLGRAAREELRWLGTVLGEARDADVLLARLRGRVEMIPATEAPGVAQVLEALQQRRKEAHTALVASISGERYVALLDRCVEAAQFPVVRPEADVPVKDLVPDCWTARGVTCAEQ
jgi:hypothetical protein